MANMRSVLILSVLMLCCGLAFSQKLGLVGKIFTSNMVLQRAPQRATIWGFGTLANEVVKVTFNGNTYMTSTAARFPFKWSLDLPATSAGFTTYTIKVASQRSGEVRLDNVVFGDVYLCGGQSNMQMGVAGAFNGSTAIAYSGHYPLIRVYTVGQTNYSVNPLFDFNSPVQGWQVSSPVSIGNGTWSYFSASCYFFGVQIYNYLNGQVPVGLLSDNWGGTIVEAWMSPDALRTCPNAVPPTAPGPVAPPNYPNVPSVLYNAMIYPILNLKLRGFLWYQGESNSGNPGPYACLFPAMIKDWRIKFGYTNPEDLPFLFVQLAPWLGIGNLYNLPQTRQSQMAALGLPAVGYASAMDKGDSDPKNPIGSIHPRDKEVVGLRLSKAMKYILFKDLTQLWTGPILQTAYWVRTNNAVEIALNFNATSVGSQIVVKSTPACPVTTPGYCAGFEVQGTDTKWYTAQTGGASGPAQVIIAASLPTGINPVQGRYAWANWPLATVYDSDDNPLVPTTFATIPRM